MVNIKAVTKEVNKEVTKEDIKADRRTGTITRVEIMAVMVESPSIIKAENLSIREETSNITSSTVGSHSIKISRSIDDLMYYLNYHYFFPVFHEQSTCRVVLS